MSRVCRYIYIYIYIYIYTTLSCRSGEDCKFSFLICIIYEWMLCVEFCPTPSLCGISPNLRSICSRGAAHTCDRSTRFIWQLTPRPATTAREPGGAGERERQKGRGRTKAKEVNPSCLIKPVTIRQRLQLALARFIPPRDAVMERGGKRQTGGGTRRLEPQDLSECGICCVWQRQKAGGE